MKAIRPLLVPSVYEITATVETSEADSDLSNNTSTLRVEVVDAISGGGSDSPAVTVSKVRLAPVNPKAGSLVFASVQIFAGAVPVKPTRLICAATVDGVKLVGTPRGRAGKATCSYRPKKLMNGKTLRGTIAASRTMTCGGFS